MCARPPQACTTLERVDLDSRIPIRKRSSSSVGCCWMPSASSRAFTAAASCCSVGCAKGAFRLRNREKPPQLSVQRPEDAFLEIQRAFLRLVVRICVRRSTEPLFVRHARWGGPVDRVAGSELTASFAPQPYNKPESVMHSV